MSVYDKNMRLTCCCIFLDLSLLSVAMCSDVSLFRVLDDSMNPLVSSEDSPNSFALLNSFLSSFFEFDFMLKLHNSIKLWERERWKNWRLVANKSLFCFCQKIHVLCSLFNLATFIRIFMHTTTNSYLAIVSTSYELHTYNG